MYGPRMFSIMGRQYFVPMGRFAILFGAHISVVSIRLDNVICRTGKYSLYNDDNDDLLIVCLFVFCRTDHYHLINSTLSLAGCLENSLDHIFFYVHYSIPQYGGANEHLNWRGVASLTS